MHHLVRALNVIWGLLTIPVLVTNWGELTTMPRIVLAVLCVTAVYNVALVREECAFGVMLTAAVLNLFAVTVTARDHNAVPVIGSGAMACVK